MIVCGIDPGATGGIACYNPDTGEAWGELVRTTDPLELCEFLRVQEPDCVGIEVPVGRPPQHGGFRQIAQQWRAIGVPEGVVGALGLPLVTIQPREWTAIAFRGSKAPKEYTARKRLSLDAARRRFPSASLARVKDQPIADAIWIALATLRRVREEV